MKKIFLVSLAILSFTQIVVGQTTEDDLSKVKSDISSLLSKQSAMQTKISSNRSEIVFLTSQNKFSIQKIDSLKQSISELEDSLYSINNQLKEANNIIYDNEAQLSSSIQNRSVIGIVILALLFIIGVIVSFLLGKKVNMADSAIENVREAQSQLQAAQKKLKEESILLDNKLVELIEKKINSTPTEAVVDHSLALKVADEITRIELNLSRMDSSIKGYKQLTKGIERIKNNFLAKGYEITEMLGKPYDEGMRINADFVLDESLEPGVRVITSITKPEVLYNGELIQKAIVTITQNI